MIDCRACQFASSDFVRNLSISKDICSVEGQLTNSEVEARFPHIFESTLRCTLQPSGPINGQCPYYNPHPKKQLVRFEEDEGDYSCLASNLGSQQEINLLFYLGLSQKITRLLNLVIVEKIYAKGGGEDMILIGHEVMLEGIEFVSFLSFYQFLRDIQAQGAETLYINLT